MNGPWSINQMHPQGAHEYARLVDRPRFLKTLPVMLVLRAALVIIPPAPSGRPADVQRSVVYARRLVP
jgi:hypothetical protein